MYIYQSSVRILHSFASRSRVCAFTCKNRGEKIIFLKFNVIKISNCVNNFNVSPAEPLPLNVLCHSAAARSFLHTLW